MSKKAYTLVEVILVIGILGIMGALSLPFALRSFGGFNQILNSETAVDSLQEIYTVISRRVINKAEPATAAHLNEIIEEFADKTPPPHPLNYYRLPNKTLIKKLINEDISTYTYILGNETKYLPNSAYIKLEATNASQTYNLNFVLYPAVSIR